MDEFGSKMTAAEKRAIWADILKGAAGSVGLSIYVLADTFFVAQRFGTEGVSVMNVAMPLFNIIEGLGMMLGMGGATLFTIQKIRHPKRARETFPQIVLVAVIVGLIFTCLGALAAPLVTRLLGATGGRLYALTLPYVRITLLGGPVFVLSNFMIGFIRNDNDPALATVALLLSSCWNILADWLFILVFDWGMQGAALATATAPLACVLIQLCHWLPFRHRSTLPWRGPRPRFSLVSSAVRIGAPSFLMEMANGVIIFVFNWVILLVAGQNALSAYGIATNLLLVALALFTGTAQGTQPTVSRAYGKREGRKAFDGLLQGVTCALLIAGACYAATVIFRDPLIAVFNNDHNQAVAKLAATGLPIIMASLFFSAVNSQLSIFFASVNAVGCSLGLVLLRGYGLVWLTLLPLAKLAGVTGVWWSLPALEVVGLGIALVLFFQVAKRLKKITVKSHPGEGEPKETGHYQ